MAGWTKVTGIVVTRCGTTHRYVCSSTLLLASNMNYTAAVEPARAAGEHAAQARQDLDPDADSDAETDVHERVRKQKTSRSRAVSPILGVLLLGMGSRICPTGSSLTIEHTHTRTSRRHMDACIRHVHTDVHRHIYTRHGHTDTLDRHTDTHTRVDSTSAAHTNKNCGIKRLFYPRIQKEYLHSVIPPIACLRSRAAVGHLRRCR